METARVARLSFHGATNTLSLQPATKAEILHMNVYRSFAIRRGFPRGTPHYDYLCAVKHPVSTDIGDPYPQEVSNVPTISFPQPAP